MTKKKKVEDYPIGTILKSSADIFIMITGSCRDNYYRRGVEKRYLFVYLHDNKQGTLPKRDIDAVCVVVKGKRPVDK